MTSIAEAKTILSFTLHFTGLSEACGVGKGRGGKMVEAPTNWVHKSYLT